MSEPRVLFYVQHLLGIGHLKRAVTLAKAMRRVGLAVTVVSGGEKVPVIDVDGIDFVQLPSARAADRSFRILLDESGAVVDDAWRDQRRERLLELLATLKPSALVIELYPFGRRQLRHELIPLLKAARDVSPRPAIVSSVRDILVEKAKPERNKEMIEIVQAYFDAVLVHGDPDLVPFDATFPYARDLGSRLRYTGYVVDAVAAAGQEPARHGVIVSAGGGAVGDDLLRTAMLARPLSRLSAEPWHVLAGYNLPDAQFLDLAKGAPNGVTVERARPDFVNLMRASVLSISQGGYNTVMELLATGTRGVIVPYAGGEETEQTIRAQLLAQRGLVTIADEVGLTPEKLAFAVDAAVDLVPQENVRPNLGGAEESALTIAALAAQSQ